MKIKNIVFDMDGTILDTITDIREATNFALRKCGYPERTLTEVLSFVGNGIKVLIERAVPNNISAELVDKCLVEFKGYYDIHKNDNTKPYPQILQLMSELRDMGINMSVVSNKFDAGVKELAEQLFTGFLPIAIGESDTIVPKPNPSGVWYAMELMNANKNDTVYIGDSEVDFQTAKNSEIEFIGVSWGFRTRLLLEQLGSKYIVDSPLEIIDVIKEI